MEKKRIVLILIYVMWAVLILGLLFLPDNIPIHWSGGSTVPDGYGSKFLLIIIPFMFSLLGLGLLGVASVMKNEKYGNGKSTYAAVMNTDIVMCALIDIFFVCFMIYLFLHTS